jgi:hypothetical protein
MSQTTRFLTGSLASIAVASGVGLAAPAAYADAPTGPCGQPAVAPIFMTLVHEPELQQVPAVTHDEWRWERQVTSFLHEFAKVVTPAYTVNDWTRTLPDTTKYQWSRKVVTQEARDAVPAVDGHWVDVLGDTTGTGVEYEYVQQQTQNTQWRPAGWNGEKADEDKGQGWTRTGNARQWVDGTPGSAAVPEISHLEYLWAPTSPGAGWVKTDAEPSVTPGGTDTATTHGDNTPGDGWTLVHTHVVPAVMSDPVWASVAPEGYSATDADPLPEVVMESTEGTSADSPAGDGWSKIDGSLTTIVDHEATTRLVGGGTEQVQVAPGRPATAPCPTVQASTSHVAGPATSRPTSSATSSTAATVAAPGHADTVLPATGSPVSPLLLTTGLGALLTGGALVRVGRRRTS